MSTVGVILSTVGGDHDAHGDSWVPWRENLLLLSTPQYWTPPQYSNFKGWYPPWYWTPSTVLMTSPTCIMISPTVLKISPTVLKISPMVLTISPYSTQDIPHGTHDIPPWYWTPPWYCTPPRYCTHIIQGDLLNWRSWKIQTWHDDRHAVHQCFCTKFDSWYLDLTSSILSELDIHFCRILLISQYFLQFKSTSELKFGLLVAWLMMNIYWWNLNSNELKWHHNDFIFFVQFYCYNPCWCQQIFKFDIHWK